MNKINYDRLMQKKLEEFRKEKGREPRILLHTCCTPCLMGCLGKLEESEITLYFYNPNIEGLSEYQYRLGELYKYERLSGNNLKVVEGDYDHKAFLENVKGLENEPERGRRCQKCFYMRLSEAAKNAKKDDYDYFATTLTLSPLKNAAMINSIGEEVGKEYGVEYLVSDFKKRDGFKTSVDLSNEYGLYRQDYCGCEFSKEKK